MTPVHKGRSYDDSSNFQHPISMVPEKVITSHLSSFLKTINCCVVIKLLIIYQILLLAAC